MQRAPDSTEIVCSCPFGTFSQSLLRHLLIVVLFTGIHGRGLTAEIDYRTVAEKLEQLAEIELERQSISGVSIALVDDQRIVYANGFGFADKKRDRPVTTNTVFRAGSISKLFTALAAMQLAERGLIDIDQPVSRYVPGFRIIDPFDDASPVTLRQLMCHRSGLIRESPVGNYFDSSEPGTDATVASLASCVLVHPPGTKTKYSNSGVTVVGKAVSDVSGIPFEKYAADLLLGPLGMRDSSFILTRELKPKLAKGYLPVAQSGGGFREIEAPQFEFGILPAGNLYTTAVDLGRFLTMLFAEGRINGHPIVRPETLREMFTPQLTDSTNGFGLGFSVGHRREYKTVSHMGAVYGFTSSLTAIPAHKVGVIVLCNDDIAIGPVRKLSGAALDLMIEAKLSDRAPSKAPVITPRDLSSFAGDFESESFWARLDPASDGQSLAAIISGQSMIFVPVGELAFEASGRLSHESQVAFERNDNGGITGFKALGQTFRRVEPGRVSDVPRSWQRFIGSYGPNFIPLIISVKHGHLYAMTENEFDYRLTPINQTVFKMPPGLYMDEHLVFQLDRRGRVHSAVLANIPLARRE